MRIRLLAALSLWVVFLWGALAAAAPSAPIRLVSDVWPPFTDAEGKPHEAIDLVRAALLRGGMQSKVAIMTFSVALEQLQQGKADGSAAVWKSPDREAYLLFSKPYLENRLVLVTRKGENAAFSSLSELKGKRLALTKAYAYGDSVTKAPNLEFVYRDSDADCLRAVLAKEADYLLLDELMVRHLFEFYASKANTLIAVGQTAIVRYPLYFALRKDYPRAAEIVAEFNRNIEHMMSDGTYNTLLHVAWIRTDVDGDGVPDYVSSKRVLAKNGVDPSASKTGYAIFYPETGPPGMTRTPAYLVDGKSYDTWGDAATTINRSGTTKPQGLYKYSTGFVLMDF